MKNKSRLLAYLLINILVSATTTLAVLWLWERAHPRPVVSERPANLIVDKQNQQDQVSEPQPAEEAPISEPTQPLFSSGEQVEIHLIVGAGNLDLEYVEIRNNGEDPVDLTGWLLINESNEQFTFPGMILNSGGAVKILSRAGTNTVIELYWQADTPIWRSGGTARLLNARGELVTTYSIP